MESALAVALASLSLSFASFFIFRAYLRRRTGAERILAEFRSEVGQLIAEIDAATDRDATLVEERVKNLRAVLAETERRMAALTRELDRRAGTEQAYADLGRRAPRTLAPAPVSAIEKTAAAVEAAAPEPTPKGVELAGSTESAQKNAELPTPTLGAPRVYRSATPIEPHPAPFAERAAELFRAGFSADLIATRLGATVAEVDLAVALALRQNEAHGDDDGN